MQVRKQTFISSVALLLLCTSAVLNFGCARNQNAAAQQQPQAMPVAVEKIEAKPVEDFTEYLASVRSRGSATIQPQVDGLVTKIFVRSGQRVSAGQALLQIDPQRQQAAVRTQEAAQQSREAQLELARKELERRRALFKEGVIALQDLDAAESAFNAARADVQSLGASVRQQEEQLAYYTVRALNAGVVGDIPVRVGDRVQTDTVVTTVNSGGTTEAYINIPIERADEVKVGTPVILLDDEGNEFRTKITFVSPQVDTKNQLLLVKAELPQNRGYRDEQLLHARVVWRTLTAPLVPVTGVTRLNGQIFVFVVGKNDKGQNIAQQKLLRTGDIVNNSYVVLEGIQPGEQLITSGLQVLRQGMPVQPMDGPPGGQQASQPGQQPGQPGASAAQGQNQNQQSQGAPAGRPSSSNSTSGR